jgi:taurine dioxygenase
MSKSRVSVEVVPTGAACGAEIRGDVIFGILDAFHAHQVLIFRDQELSEARQLEFAQWFGPLNRPPKDIPVLGDDDQPPIVPISNTAEGGMLGNRDLFPHSDMSYLPVPLLGAQLYAVEVPPSGGDTSFANLYQAYEDLDAETKELIAGLKVWSYNPYTPRFADRGAALGGANQKFVEEDLPTFPHPIVRTHPVTGRKSLYIGGLCEEIVGMDDAEAARALLNRLLAHVDQAHYYYTHHWRPGDLVIWDNRCTNHKRTTWDNAQSRLMYRVQIAGTIPF